MLQTTPPSLFGLNRNNCNKNFLKEESWGKNQFNNAFPVALACFMESEGINPTYLKLIANRSISQGTIPFNEVFGLNALSENIFFSFEDNFPLYRPMVVNHLPRIDLVTINIADRQNRPLKGLEIKLTALPDHTTCELTESEYGSEIVVRPDTIVYLALSIARIFQDEREQLNELFESLFEQYQNLNWEEFSEIRPIAKELAEFVDNILISHNDLQSPFMMQPIWKTVGKSLQLHENCFDIFVWSDFAFTRLFINHFNEERQGIDRKLRTLIWLIKMIYDYSENNRIDHRSIIDRFTYDTKNDKAFAIGGRLTNQYLKGTTLQRPRIRRDQIRNIILGGGEKFLSPERRLDAAILTTPGIFD
jgi:hypothetical protein